MSPQVLKKALVSNGFEVFRTLQGEVVLAERVRENLILDSGVRLGPADEGRLRVRVVFRAQKTDFPSEDEESLFRRARELSQAAVADGFAEIATNVHAIKDPVDAERVLDTVFEVHVAREVATMEEATPVLKFALSLDKAAGAR